MFLGLAEQRCLCPCLVQKRAAHRPAASAARAPRRRARGRPGRRAHRRSRLAGRRATRPPAPRSAPGRAPAPRAPRGGRRAARTARHSRVTAEQICFMQLGAQLLAPCVNANRMVCGAWRCKGACASSDTSKSIALEGGEGNAGPASHAGSPPTAAQKAACMLSVPCGSAPG